MGSLTYVGNGPNLMVKEIAEHRGIRMPNFLLYTAIATVVMIPPLVVASYLLPAGS
jgi:Na+/H+ antiporter NhaD/arsenite permease-like protein